VDCGDRRVRGDHEIDRKSEDGREGGWGRTRRKGEERGGGSTSTESEARVCVRDGCERRRTRQVVKIDEL
jgi:hypothetical protein